MPAPWVGGVASGLASHFGVSVWWTRVAFALFSAVGGLGLAAYMWLWLSLPTDTEASEGQQESVRATRRPLRLPMPQRGARRDRQMLVGQLVLGGVVFLGLAGFLLVNEALWGMSWSALVWVLFVLAGVIMTWMQAPKFAKRRNFEALAFVTVGLALMIAGVMFLLEETGVIPGLRVGLKAGFILIAAMIIALVPLGVQVIEEMTRTRAREAGEAQRADIAAHLHDSVLQTLTLIRARAGDEAAVRALALTQERELRSWLYTGQSEPHRSVAQALKDEAASVEASYGVPVEVVTVGDMEPDLRHLGAVAAAGEAMTNAAKHAAPPITVFQEVFAGQLDISVRDSGKGFDPESIPEDRHGFKGSILGRVERVGGTVDIRFRPPRPKGGLGAADGVGGTEIRIRIPPSEDLG